MNFLLTDANASGWCDILTIIVQEDHRANDSADGEGRREQEGRGILSMIFNNRFMQKVFGGADQSPEIGFQFRNEFSGESSVDRSSQFNSRISATVVKIDEAGNFLVEARKTIRIGEEYKSIVLSGKVRPRDIINNTILSYQIADAKSVTWETEPSRRCRTRLCFRVLQFPVLRHRRENRMNRFFLYLFNSIRTALIWTLLLAATSAQGQPLISRIKDVAT